MRWSKTLILAGSPALLLLVWLFGLAPVPDRCGQPLEAPLPAYQPEVAALPPQALHEPYVPPAAGQLHIEINLDTRRLTLFLNHLPIRSYPVAVGKGSTPTPPGRWRVIYKARNWGGGFGTRWLGLNVPWGIYGIHGTNKPGSIGSRASAGCVRMFNRHVEELFELVPLGTTVQITGGPGPGHRAVVNGDRGADVLMLQSRLHELGLYDGPLDGVFGWGTEQAVRRLQKERGLPVDGVVRRQTWAALGFAP